MDMPEKLNDIHFTEWIDPKEKLPPNEETVFVIVERKTTHGYGNKFITIAFHINEGSYTDDLVTGFDYDYDTPRLDYDDDGISFMHDSWWEQSFFGEYVNIIDDARVIRWSHCPDLSLLKGV